MSTTYMLNMAPIDVMSSGVRGQKIGFSGFWLVTLKLVDRMPPNLVGMRNLPLYTSVQNFKGIRPIGAEISCIIYPHFDLYRSMLM